MTDMPPGSNLIHRILELEEELKQLNKDLTVYKQSELDLQATMLDLSVHQEELRAQNDDLRSVRRVLESSQEKYYRLFNFAPIGYLTLNANSQIKEINLIAARLIGHNHRRLISKPLFLYVAPEDRDKLTAHIHEASQVGDSQTQLSILNQEMIPIPVLMRSISIEGTPNEKDSPKVMVSITDIRELVEAREQARVQTQQYQHLFSYNPIGLAVFQGDIKGKNFTLQEINPAGVGFFNRPRSKLIGGSVKDVFSGTVDINLCDVFQQVWLTGVAQEYKATHFQDEFTEGWLTYQIYRLPTGNIVTVFKDVTNIFTLEAKQREQEEIFAHFVQEATEGVTIVDENGIITTWNKAQENITGVLQEVAIGSELWSVQFRLGPPEKRVPEVLAAIKKSAQEMLKTGKAPWLDKRVTSTIYHTDGTTRDVETITFKLQNNDNFMFASIMTDVTELTKANKQLQVYSGELEDLVEKRTFELAETQKKLHQQEKLVVLGQMAATVAHEIRNPIGVISNASSLIQMRATEIDDGMQKNFTLIKEQIQKVATITSELANFARGTSVKPQTELVNVSELVEKILSLVPRPDNITAVTEFDHGETPARFDPIHLDQILTNLISNGYEAMPAGGTLTITTKQEAHNIVIDVSDTGVGISTEQLKSIFEPLFTTKSTGLGLGLAICHSLTQLNNSTITVRSEVHEGTTFTLVLPT